MFVFVKDGKDQLEHVIIAESAIGHKLPVRAEIHHIDENRARLDADILPMEHLECCLPDDVRRCLNSEGFLDIQFRSNGKQAIVRKVIRHLGKPNKHV